MHLFVLSPALDRLWHLHPREVTTGTFEQQLPETPQGEYALFADLVHKTGLSETVTGTLNAPAIQGAPLSGDDSAWAGTEPTVRLKADTTYDRSASSTSASSPSDVVSGFSRTVDGGRIVWDRGAKPLATKRLTLFTFLVQDANGQPGDRPRAVHGQCPATPFS
jgi:hypothetical protein